MCTFREVSFYKVRSLSICPAPGPTPMSCTKTLVGWWGAPRFGPSDDQVNEVGYCGVCGANENLGEIPITIYLGVFYTINGEKSPYEITIATRAPPIKTPRRTTKITIEKPVAIEVGPPLKRLKKAGASVGLAKVASPMLTLRPRLIPEVPRGRGAAKLKDESRLVAVEMAEARANEATVKLDEVQRVEAKAFEMVKVLEKEL
ncbi:hypothetical protein B296_00052040 [Ensete ventricosum]|uniref:Uncharacterized protein n=1 Tax=Ensete ventricosum TaxID=4639 RepID=A0A426YE32_ENSVE|nr:hypothetical protein B296_00052040 [Ensete ventricosum]